MKHLQTFENFTSNSSVDEAKKFNFGSDDIKDAMVTGLADMMGMKMLDLNDAIEKDSTTRSAFNDFSYKMSKMLPKALDESNNEESVDEAKEFNVNDLPKGAIVTFKDGETWMVTKVIGNSSNPRGYMMAPYGKTKEYYISMQIEFNIKKLEDDIESVK